MILGDPNLAARSGNTSRVTLDDLFRRAVARRPEALALVDPPNRSDFTDDAPRALTYAQADDIVAAIAGRLRRMSLPTDAIVGIQLPNTVENVLTLLGVLRAGMIAAPLPQLWRRADVVAALSRLGAKALITCGHVGSVAYSNLAMHAAAEVFPIRYVCGFGRNLPNGIVPFDDLLTDDATVDTIPSFEGERAANPSVHLAVITWDVTADGMVPVARSHNELLAGGLSITLETRFDRDAIILNAVPLASFAALSLAVLPWLLNGGTLCLHQPFKPDVLAAQLRENNCETIILPGPVVARLADAGLLHPHDGLKHVLAIWRAPERLSSSPSWRETAPALIDVQVFGEAALIAARRAPHGRPATISFGRLSVPHGVAGGVPIAELTRTEAGTVGLRSPMIPRAPFPPGAERGALPYFKLSDDGTFDTGYSCRFDSDTRSMVVTGAPAGIVSVGGYRFLMSELQRMIRRVGDGAMLTALPDTFTGQRLAGSALDRPALQEMLVELGLNPLLIAAFRSRRGGTRGSAA